MGSAEEREAHQKLEQLLHAAGEASSFSREYNDEEVKTEEEEEERF
jgi:hypothetical protein